MRTFYLMIHRFELMALEIMGNYLIKHVLQCNAVAACHGCRRTRLKKLCFWKSSNRKFVRVPEERKVTTKRLLSILHSRCTQGNEIGSDFQSGLG